MPRSVISIAWRVILAALASALGFWALVYPQAPALLGWPVANALYRVLDAPVSCLNLVLPSFLKAGFARQFSNSTYCFPGPLWYEWSRYVAVGIPAYVGLLYVPALVLFIGRRRSPPHG